MQREYPEAPIVGVGAVVVEDGRVLLVKRGHPPLQGEWSLPGGALELGETLQQGVMREVLEETGLSVVPAGIVEVLDRITRGDQGILYHYVLIDFVCHPTGGTLAHGSDADDALWVARERLDQYGLPQVTLRVIEKALSLGSR